MKETQSPPTDPGRRHLTVVSSRGSRQPFLRGMITHHLMQRGLDFDRAYATANAIRHGLRDQTQITTAEVRDLVTEELERTLGPNVAATLSDPSARAPTLLVRYHGQKQPFSRGVLARSILAAGIDQTLAYRLASDLHADLRREGVGVLPSDELVHRVGALLDEHADKKAATRYRLVRRIHRLPRPLVIYIGGASGTGKSTLALELAPLLRIYRINATDTIRQVMRMVFSPAMLPVLHGSSFEASKVQSTASPDQRQRLQASFEEQTERVLVGVRAVVERAIAENMSILVEGVHLYPPLIPFQDLEGAAYQVPLVLGTLDDEIHRTRFLSRARLGGRRAERYLENFESIRIIHDHILRQTEEFDTPFIDNSTPDPPVQQTLQVVTGALERRLPALAAGDEPEAAAKPPALLIIIDGLADRPIRALGGRTPLQAAHTPTLDRLAREGRCGLADTIAPGVVPDTASGSLALFGQSPLALKRGPVEAVGAGIHLSPGDVALRANFATLDTLGQVMDRRAGRIREDSAGLAATLDRLPLPGSMSDEIEVRVKSATEHRLAVVLRGEGLSSAIQGSDPGEGAAPGPPLTPQPNDPEDVAAVRTARALALFEQEARRVLAGNPINRRRIAASLPPANALLSRGAGRIHRLLPLEQAGLPLQVACVAGDRTILGLASWLGADTISSPKMTANLDTDVEVKFQSAFEALAENDLVLLHLKGADIASHDQRPDLKVQFIERLDRALGDLVERAAGEVRIAVASDHATLSESGQHGADPLPVLIWEKNGESDPVEQFDEHSVAGGALNRFPLQLLLGQLFDLR